MLKVLIAIDGSPICEEALALGARLLVGQAAEVTVLHVIERHLVLGRDGPVVAEQNAGTDVLAASEGLLDEAIGRLRDAGVGPVITKQIAYGNPAEMILRTADERNSDLIVVGSRGLHGSAQFRLGSVSTQVCSHARGGVLVAHPRSRVTSLHSAGSGETLAR